MSEILGSEIRRLDRVVRTFLDFTRPGRTSPRRDRSRRPGIEDVFRMAGPRQPVTRCGWFWRGTVFEGARGP